MADIHGKVIKEIFREAKKVATLHSVLTSPRGNYFRLNLLHRLQESLTESELVRLSNETGLSEYQRHISMLLENQLLEETSSDSEKTYVRTKQGLRAVNAVAAFERRLDIDSVHKLFDASLGINSIRFFLKVYGQKREMFLDEQTREFRLRFEPIEIGKLARFLPRTVEGLSAIDKLQQAELLVYEGDGYVYLSPIKARSFYQYLEALFAMIQIPFFE